MDVDTIRLSPAQRAEHMRNNKCFICHKVRCWTDKHPHPGNKSKTRPSPASSSSFARTAVVSEATLLLDYARKLNITEEEAISSLGIVYGELNQDGNPTESLVSESVASINQGFLIRRTASTSVSPSHTIVPVFVASRESKSIQIPISLTGENRKTAETQALVDCGASGCFVDVALVTCLGWKTTRLASPRTAYNVDEIPNNNSLIQLTVSLTLWIGDKDERCAFYVIQCGNEDVILGLPWLQEANPSIDWAAGTVVLPD